MSPFDQLASIDSFDAINGQTSMLVHSELVSSFVPNRMCPFDQLVSIDSFDGINDQTGMIVHSELVSSLFLTECVHSIN